MGASQDEGIDVFREDRFEIFLSGKTGNGVIQPPFFYQRDKKRAGFGKNSDAGIVFVNGAGIRIAVDCRRCTDDANNFVPRFGNGDTGARVYYIQHRNGRKALNLIVCDSGNGIAGDDEQLHILFQ